MPSLVDWFFAAARGFIQRRLMRFVNRAWLRDRESWLGCLAASRSMRQLKCPTQRNGHGQILCQRSDERAAESVASANGIDGLGAHCRSQPCPMVVAPEHTLRAKRDQSLARACVVQRCGSMRRVVECGQCGRFDLIDDKNVDMGEHRSAIEAHWPRIEQGAPLLAPRSIEHLCGHWRAQ